MSEPCRSGGSQSACRSNPLCWRPTRRIFRRPGWASRAGRVRAMSRLTWGASPRNWLGCAASKSMKSLRPPVAMRTRSCRGFQYGTWESVDFEPCTLYDTRPGFLLGYQQVCQFLSAGPHYRETGVLERGPHLLIIQGCHDALMQGVQNLVRRASRCEERKPRSEVHIRQARLGKGRNVLQHLAALRA